MLIMTVLIKMSASPSIRSTPADPGRVVLDLILVRSVTLPSK